MFPDDTQQEVVLMTLLLAVVLPLPKPTEKPFERQALFFVTLMFHKRPLISTALLSLSRKLLPVIETSWTTAPWVAP